MLDQEQRIVVVIQALEFCKSGDQGVSQIELGFISALADGLNITEEEYNIIEKFVLNHWRIALIFRIYLLLTE